MTFFIVTTMKTSNLIQYSHSDFYKSASCIVSNLWLILSIGAALENLSAARVGIMGEGTNACCSAVAIAVRYAAVRKQFGPKPDIELPIMEYQLHVSV
jgi:hypothetical protein